LLSVIQLPGSNDDRDTLFAFKAVLGCDARLVWHKDSELPPETRAIVLPGGFSYGDYLRCGAMAQYAPIMAAVKRFAAAGGPVLGICNGFQVLWCDFVDVRVERAVAPFSSRARVGDVLRLPIKHGEGAYFAHADDLEELEREGRVALRYCEVDGSVTRAANPNGTLGNIAGIVNAAGNVMGLMPHPEHAVEADLGGEDGRVLLGSMLDHVLLEGR
jgi:phosphoribosylformylglycinamidine synthase